MKTMQILSVLHSIDVSSWLLRSAETKYFTLHSPHLNWILQLEPTTSAHHLFYFWHIMSSCLLYQLQEVLEKHHQATMEGGWGGWRGNLFEKVIIFCEWQTDRIFWKRSFFVRDRYFLKVIIFVTDGHHHCRRWSLCFCWCAQVTLVVFL